MPEQIEILFVSLEGKLAGAEQSLLLLMAGLSGGYRMHLVCPGGSDLAQRARELGVDCQGLPEGRILSYRSWAWMILWIKINWRILRLIVQLKPQIIHANSAYAVTGAAFPALLTRRPLIWHARDLTQDRWVVRLCGWCSTRVVAISRTVQTHLLQRGVFARKIEVIYNGIQTAPRSHRTEGMAEETTGPAKRERPKGSALPFVFANVGQFVPWKNQPLFLTAASIVARKLPAARFWLVGDDLWDRNPAYKTQLLRQVQDLGLTSHVVFKGWQEEMTAVWDQIDCLVHTAQGEPFGRVIIEAMERHVPVVAVDSGGPAEILENEVSGLLVPVNDAERLGAAMERIVGNPPLVRRLTAAAHDRVVRHFTSESTTAQVQELYRRILSP